MCGIAGYVGGVERGSLKKMNRVQRHRGPDGEGIFADAAAEVALAHTRLAILDLSAAAGQPMRSPDGRYVLIFNGEIYNFRELRANLQQRGHRFVSTGDTEVILHGVMEEGCAFLARLNGMFALAIWDRQNRELFLARDQLGIKPVYYATPKPGTLLFASEIKALCAHPEMRREPDFEVLQQHLAYCHAASDRTRAQRGPPSGARVHVALAAADAGVSDRAFRPVADSPAGREGQGLRRRPLKGTH